MSPSPLPRSNELRNVNKQRLKRQEHRKPQKPHDVILLETKGYRR